MLSLAAGILALVGSPVTDRPPELTSAAKRVLHRHWTLDAKALLVLFSAGTDLRKALAAELDRSEPSWSRIQALLGEIRRNDADTREESRRLQIELLDQLSPADRLVYLRSVYSLKDGPPPRLFRDPPPNK